MGIGLDPIFIYFSIENLFFELKLTFLNDFWSDMNFSDEYLHSHVAHRHQSDYCPLFLKCYFFLAFFENYILFIIVIMVLCKMRGFDLVLISIQKKLPKLVTGLCEFSPQNVSLPLLFLVAVVFMVDEVT